MAIIDKYRTVATAFAAVRNIAAMVNALKSYAGTIPFSALRGRNDSMRESYLTGIQPMLSLGSAAEINPVIGTFMAGSVPADAYAGFQNVGTTLLAFYTAYDVVFEGLTPIVHDPLTGHADALIPLEQLATLAPSLDAVLAATTPLV